MTTSGRQARIDTFIDAARRAHQDASDCEEHAKLHRARRDVFIRRLYETKLFSYSKLGELIGGSPELIAKIVRGQARKKSKPSKRT